ncbi:MAG: hypothetical protein K8T91_14475 [Planctomycetes bacterium]|nr:hypothetical protein [Planctomycetota bacterium]
MNYSQALALGALATAQAMASNAEVQGTTPLDPIERHRNKASGKLSRIIGDLMTVPRKGVTLIFVVKLGDELEGAVGPTTSAGVALAEWAMVGEVSDRHVPPTYGPVYGVHEQGFNVADAMTEWISRLRQLEELQFAVLWHADGEQLVHFDRSDAYSVEEACKDILAFLQYEVSLLAFAAHDVWD